MTIRYEYGILLSHASEATIPGLVIAVPGPLTVAFDEAARVARAAGVKARVMRRAIGTDEWRTSNRLTPQEALDIGSIDGFAGNGWLP